jgi:hypothetical protein
VRTKYINATKVIQKLFGYDGLTGFIFCMHNHIIITTETLNSLFYTSCYITPKIYHIIVAHVDDCIASLHRCNFILTKIVVRFLIFRIGTVHKKPCPLRHTLWLVAQPSAEKRCDVDIMATPRE